MNFQFPISNFRSNQATTASPHPHVPASPRQSRQWAVGSRREAQRNPSSFLPAQHSAPSTQNSLPVISNQQSAISNRQLPSAYCLLPTARYAFSFTEILFAVMILGIGFIMVAAMFPVALSQTENSTSETIAAAAARSGIAYVTSLGQTTFVSRAQPVTQLPTTLLMLRPTLPFPTLQFPNDYRLLQLATTSDPSLLSLFPPLPTNPLTNAVYGSKSIPGEVWPLDFATTPSETSNSSPELARAIDGTTITPVQTVSELLWGMASQNMILSSNPRFAWVAFYKRDMIESATPTGNISVSYAPYAQAIIITVQSRNTDSFVATTDLNRALGPSLEPTAYTGVQFIAPAVMPYNFLQWGIQFAVNASEPPDRTAEDAFVVVATDSLLTTNPYHGLLNGHVFRIGNRPPPGLGAGNVWELAPGFSLSGGDVLSLQYMGASTTFSVYVLGKGRDPNAGTTPNVYGGPAQDIAVYSSFVPCPTN